MSKFCEKALIHIEKEYGDKYMYVSVIHTCMHGEEGIEYDKDDHLMQSLFKNLGYFPLVEDVIGEKSITMSVNDFVNKLGKCKQDK